MNTRQKIVLDSNVVLDWFVFRNPGVGAVVKAIEDGRVQWIGSVETRAEMGHVLARGGLVAQDLLAEHVLTSIDQHQVLVPQPVAPRLPRLRCSDPSDQKFIDLALGHQARWLLTRDRALLKLSRKTAPLGLLVVVPERWQMEPASATA